MTVPIPQRHGPHVHIPWSPVASILVVATAVIAVVVVLLVVHPWDSGSPGATADEAATSTALTGQAVAVPKPESPWMLHHLVAPRTAPVPAAAGASANSASGVVIHQLVRGVDLDPRGYGDVQPPAPRYLPGTVANPHPLNVVAGAPR